MTAWGVYDKVNHKFVRHPGLYHGKTAESRSGWQLFKYDTELEAVIDHQERFRWHPDYEVIELPADEPEWVF